MILGVMADGLDVGAVRVVREGTMVIRVAMVPQARRAIAGAACHDLQASPLEEANFAAAARHPPRIGDARAAART
jgi:hypothetical protein